MDNGQHIEKLYKWQKFLQSVNIDEFIEDYYKMTNNELCDKYSINSNIQKKICKHLNIRKSKEQIYEIKKRVFYDHNDWSQTVQLRRETTLKIYGVDNVNKLLETKQKIKDTKLQRYGDSGFNNMEKIKSTNLQKYGVEHVFQNQDIKQKIKQTMISRYGVDNPQKCESIKQATMQTNIRKYGVPYATQTLNTILHTNTTSSIKKCNETKRNRKSFNKSQEEDIVYNHLCQMFGERDVIRQYRDERYPFACDFYIKSLDLFIECNFHWTHGGRNYDENDEFCIQQLKNWQEKAQTSKFYKNAIQTWTVRDVIKSSYYQNINIEVFYCINDVELWCLQFNELTTDSRTRLQQELYTKVYNNYFKEG